jgi:hypothetical protein
MASALNLLFVVLFSLAFSGCYTPDVIEVSTKLSSQCGLSPSGPACVANTDAVVMDHLWERFILAEVTSPEVESCVLALDCGSDANDSELNDGALAQELDACVNADAESKNPACMWGCLSDFFSCSPAEGQACDVAFVDECIDTRESCEYRC